MRRDWVACLMICTRRELASSNKLAVDIRTFLFALSNCDSGPPPPSISSPGVLDDALDNGGGISGTLNGSPIPRPRTLFDRLGLLTFRAASSCENCSFPDNVRLLSRAVRRRRLSERGTGSSGLGSLMAGWDMMRGWVVMRETRSSMGGGVGEVDVLGWERMLRRGGRGEWVEEVCLA